MKKGRGGGGEKGGGTGGGGTVAVRGVRGEGEEVARVRG